MAPTVSILRDDRFTVRIGRVEVSGLTVDSLKELHQVTGAILRGDGLTRHHERIIDEVCKFYGITQAEIMKKTRTMKYCFPRHVAIYLISKKTQLTMTCIGQLFGDLDHGTVFHACRKIKNAVEMESGVAAEVEEIMRCVEKSMGGFMTDPAEPKPISEQKN